MFVLFENNFQFWCKKSGRALYVWQIFCLYETLVNNIVSVAPKQVTSIEPLHHSASSLVTDWLPETWVSSFGSALEKWVCDIW